MTDWNKIFHDMIAEELRRAKRDRLRMLQKFHASRPKVAKLGFISRRPQAAAPWQR